MPVTPRIAVNSASAIAPVGAVDGAPRVILRIEGSVLLAAAVAAYAMSGGSWALFAALVLLPDLSMLGYLIDQRRGAVLYNLGHSTVLPAFCTAGGLWLGNDLATGGGLVWLAHIGIDRAMGYGLKYPDGFKSTHLGKLFSRDAVDGRGSKR